MTDTTPVPFGPTGEAIYKRTYSRVKPNGERETWPETVARVATGNLALVYGPSETWSSEVQAEWDRLVYRMHRFEIIPAGRHLWASGVKGRQYLFNCHVSGWGKTLSQHFEFTFLRLMEGGGVGANYSSKYLAPFGSPRRDLKVHVVCDPSHPDYADMLAAGVLSDDFDSDWDGAFEVEDSREGWADALVDLIDTYMTDDTVKHADRVLDVSRVRGKGARLKTFGGTASGPLPFAVMMHEVSRVLNEAWEAGYPGDWAPLRPHITPVEAMEIDHAIAECVVSGGNRRSARMAICKWDDPFIEDFLACKADGSKHWTTNISVEVGDDFFASLEGNKIEGQSSLFHTELDLARKVHETVVKGMLTNGEPGYWNSSLSNVGEVGEVIATNPCLTGDTVIATIEGPRTFAELALAGEDVQVYSWHPKSKRPVIRWMRRPHLTATDVPVLEIEFDSGLKVRATPDHGFFTFRGKRIEARDLTVGRSVRAWSMSQHRDGHLRVHGWDAKRDKAVHQWVHRMLWENEIGPIPEGYVIDHIDGDPTNNCIENFQLLTPEEHNSKHYADRFANGFDGTCRNHKVVAIREAGTADVFNGMVEDSHTYVILDPNPVAGISSGIVSANCGEIALEEWENCNLGHVNLDAFVKGIQPDYRGLREAHTLMARFLIRATYGDVNDEGQAAKLASNRRIGVGHLGVQGFFAKQGLRYSVVPSNLGAQQDLAWMKDVVRNVARTYAFELRIPEPVKVTTVAPTGTIAKLPGVTEGIHPIYARHFNHRVRFSIVGEEEAAMVQSYFAQGFQVEQCIYDASGNTMVVTFPTKNKLVEEVEALGYPAELVQSADELSVDSMLAFQAMYQEHYADNAVSYTVNVPEGLRASELSATIARWLPVLKGTTVMVDGTREQAPYERITEAEYLAADVKLVADGTDEDCATGACPVR